MHMNNLIEYSDNYSGTSGSLWHFKKDDIDNHVDLTVNNSSSFKYKSNFTGNVAADETVKNVKIAVPLKWGIFGNHYKCLLINCKTKLSLTWEEKCVWSNEGTAATFKITGAKLYVHVVTLSTEENVKLSKQLNHGFKASVYWNKYKVIPHKEVTPPYNGKSYIRKLLESRV